MNTVNVGKLNRRVELFKKVEAKQPTGERTHTVESLGKAWVERIEVSGNEDDNDGQILSLSVCRFIIRFTRDLLITGPQYFIRDEDGDYEIHSTQIIGRNRFLELKCSRRGQ
ncbi:MAG TPA: head-tail adaptor protein [Salinimicrobium sp.]|nr:head-tail adaptor protein [Salinimicrobium sp.]